MRPAGAITPVGLCMFSYLFVDCMYSSIMILPRPDAAFRRRQGLRFLGNPKPYARAFWIGAWRHITSQRPSLVGNLQVFIWGFPKIGVP